MKSATKGKGRCTSLPGHRCKGYGEELRAAPRQGWGAAPAAGVKVMEMHQGPRPVKGGPGRMGVNIWAQTKSHGGSRGPLDPWSASTASKRWGEALERLCREIAQRCADGRSASEPVPLFPAAVQAAIAKGLGLCLTSTRSRKNNDMSRRCKKEGRQVKRQVSNKPTPAQQTDNQTENY